MKSMSTAILLLCVTLFLLASLGSAQSKQQGIAIFRQAQELQIKPGSKVDMEEALRIFERVGATREKGITINQMGQIYSSLGQYTKSL